METSALSNRILFAESHNTFGPTGISHLKKESGFAYFMSNFARRRNECSNVGRMCLEGTGGSLNQQWQRIDMEMDDVELVEALEDLFQHENMMRNWAYCLAQSQRSRTDWNQARGCLGIATGEKCNLFSLTHEFFG
jgi:hypothetical protein